MNKGIKLATIVAIPLALAGCKKTLSALDIGDLLALDKSDTAAKAFNAGKTLKASKVTSVTKKIDYSKNTISTANSAAFSVKKNSKGGIDMEVNGEVVSFAAADKYIEPNLTSYGFEKNPNGGGDYKSLFSWNGTVDDIESGADADFLQVWNYVVDTGDMSTRGFAVVGAQTQSSVVKALAKATYSGRAVAEIAPADNRRARNRVSGDLELNADFAAGNVDGTISKLTNQFRNAANNGWDPTTPQNGTLMLGTSRIGSNSFAGAVSGDATLNTAINGNLSGSTYSGRFYGPEAEEVGGVIDIMGTANGNTILGNGFFVGDKN